MPSDAVDLGAATQRASHWDEPPAPRPKRTAALILVVMVTFVIVVVVSARNAWFGPAEGIAGRIRDAHSPVVIKVLYIEPNPLNPARVSVYLGHDTTQAQVNKLWCDVIVPAGGAEMYQKQLLVLWRMDQRTGEPGIFHPDTGCPP